VGVWSCSPPSRELGNGKDDITGLARFTLLRLFAFFPLSISEFALGIVVPFPEFAPGEVEVGMGGKGAVGGGPAQPKEEGWPAGVGVLVDPTPPGPPALPPPLRDSAPNPARFARSAARRADAERGTLRGGVPGPVYTHAIISHLYPKIP
jgi:hypothetical protein